MSAKNRLQGVELIDCAQANAKQGLETAAQQCGYDRDTEAFMQALQQACGDRRIHIERLSDLITAQQMVMKESHH
ncbi:MAG: hypothetical protein HC925_04755 [Coleofasciculaceae cyanobacterium SM2_3_26]|nr:hypothetical protein [Coleofasciculaceae cyanobacterium SM2_3_26]